MRYFIFVLAISALSFYANASGNHKGDHGHGNTHHDETNQGDNNAMQHSDHEHHENLAGQAGEPEKVTRTIKIAMNDTMRFSPDNLNFKAGETVHFIVRNQGKIRHEMVIGSKEELGEHAKMMRNNPHMKHADPNTISLAPGEQGDLIWQFTQAGSFDFACLIPGHLEAGMMGKISIK